MKKVLMAFMFLFASSTAIEARCDRVGIVKGLSYNGDNFLSVRTGPSTKYRSIDHLYNGDVVRICEWSRRWIRIRYSGGGYGWVYGKYIRTR